MRPKMSSNLVFDEPICLLGGGDVPSNLATILPKGPLICADSGADYALLAGREPVAIIGDMDSINPTVRARFSDLIHLVEDQSSTDFEKCLNMIEAPFIYGFGFLGRRMDHTIASLSILSKYLKCPIALIGDGDVTVLVRGQASFPAKDGMGIGILPWPEAVCETTGLNWNLNGLDLALGGQISSSNRATGNTFHITVHSGAVLVTLPVDQITTLPGAFGLSLSG